MTERRTFKKLVRARMARTGESYSTAARRVADRRIAAPRPAGLLPGYPDPLSAAPQGHHESALTHRLLAQASVAISEPMACGLGGGIGFLYAVFEYRDLPTPLLTLVAQHHPQPWTPAVLDRLGVPYTEQHSGTTRPALAKLRRALDEGRSVLVTVGRGALPWHSDAGPAEAADPYHVVVAGADGDTLYLDDPAATTDSGAVSGFQRIGTEAFGAAWAAHRKGRHHMLVVDQPAPVRDLPTAVRDAVRTTVAHLTGPVLGNSFDVNFGFSGMAKLATELTERRARTGWARRFGTAESFDHAMARLDECLERTYTAPGATRWRYADFLDEAAEVLSGAEDAKALAPAALAPAVLGPAARLLRASGDGWAAIASRARAARAAGLPDLGELQALYDELAAMVEECLRREREAVRLLGDGQPLAPGDGQPLAPGDGQRRIS